MVRLARDRGAVPVLVTAPSSHRPGNEPSFLRDENYLKELDDLIPLHQEYVAIVRELAEEEGVILCDPVYFGGSVDRSEGSERIVRLIEEAGGHAEHVPTREAVGDRLAELAQPGDRIVIMGARDDTLSVFARGLFDRLP